jgi:hypothetical protein
MRRNSKFNCRDYGREAADPDCGTCVHRNGCERFEEGSFCGKWASREPEDRGEGPAQKWARGE